MGNKILYFMGVSNMIYGHFRKKDIESFIELKNDGEIRRFKSPLWNIIRLYPDGTYSYEQRPDVRFKLAKE